MKLIVGLGNPESKYDNTYHNLGFACIDKVASHFNVEFNKKKCNALISEFKKKDEKVILAKPLTYMNLSGIAVRELCNFYKIELKDVLIIADDFDLPLGTIRLKDSGSGGTHNGLKNIVLELNSEKFCRLKIGFKQETNIPLIDLVLSKIDNKSKEIIDICLENSKNAIVDFIDNKELSSIISKYNGNYNKD